VVNLDEKEGPAIWLDEVELYACGLPGCKKGEPLNLILTAPTKIEGKFRHYFLALDLPPGGYRLATVRGRLVSGQKVKSFEYPAHYLFRATAGKTTYLGRLNLSLASDEEEPKPAGRKKEDEMESEVVDLFAYDAPAILQAYSDRHFYRMKTELMVWEEK